MFFLVSQVLSFRLEKQISKNVADTTTAVSGNPPESCTMCHHMAGRGDTQLLFEKWHFPFKEALMFYDSKWKTGTRA